VPLYHEISDLQLNLGLQAGSYQGISDFSHTAKLSIDAPDMTFTSESGYLLSPVPEPETYAILLAGLGVIGVVARRRNKLPS
jgi:hypothetical protein